MRTMPKKIPEERYQRLFETAQDGILILDGTTGKIIDANPYICSLTGYSKKEMLKKHIWQLGFFKNIAENKDKFLTLKETGYVRYEDLPLENKAGDIAYVEFISNTYLVNNEPTIQCNIRDITKRVELERLNHELNMIYDVILLCSKVVLHEKKANRLIQKICTALTSFGGVRAAWVGYYKSTTPATIEPIAQEGLEKDFFTELNLRLQQKSSTKLVENAIRKQQFFVCQDLTKKTKNKAELKHANHHQYSSVAVIPIDLDKQTPYVLVVYGKKNQVLSKEIIDLLIKLGNDIVYSVKKLKTRAEYIRLSEKINTSYSDAILALSSMVEQRDPYTAGHQIRVAELAVKIATELGLPAEQILSIRLASIVHDIGKLHIPSEILSKPSALNTAEYAIVQEHPTLGWKVLKNIDFPWPIADMVYQHHERLDGSGYPQGLKGDEILLEARIIMVADVVDAMSSNRPYRSSFSVIETLREITQAKGTLFAPQVVDACIKIIIEDTPPSGA